MKKKLAVLLVVTMLVSLLPAHMVQASASLGSTHVVTAGTVSTAQAAFLPRSFEAPLFTPFSASTPWQVTSPAAAIITATAQHQPARSTWAQNTGSNGLYVQALLNYIVDVPSIVSPSALLTLFEPHVTGSTFTPVPLQNAVLQGIGRTPASGADFDSEIFEGEIRINAGGSYELWLNLMFYQVPSGLLPLELSFDLEVTGYATPSRFTVAIPVAVPAEIPSVAVSPRERSLTAGTASAVEFAITTQNVAPGTYSFILADIENPRVAAIIPGVVTTGTITIDANGAGTLLIAGTSAMVARTWNLYFVLRLNQATPRHEVYNQLRLVIGQQDGGGGYGGGGSSEPTPQPTPSPTPTPPSGDTTIIIINNVNKVIVNKNVTHNKIVNVIKDAREQGERPKIEIELEDDEDGVKVGGGDVKDIIENDGVLIVITNNVRVEINAGEMSNWNINVDSEIIISLRPVRDEEVKDKIKNKPQKPGGAQTPEELLSLLISVVVEVNIVIDGEACSEARPMLTVDLSGKNLTAEEKAMLQGVFFFLEDPDDPDSITYILVDGILDGDIFSVPAIVANAAFFSLMLIEIEVQVVITVDIPNVLRLQLGSTIVVADGQPQPAMDVAPFLADPNDPESLMLPIRAINEIFGGTASWNSQLRMVVVVNVELNINFSFRIDQPLPDGGGEAEVIDGRTFVPRRFMADMMGINVDYDPDTDAIYVVNPCGDGSVCGTVCPPCSSGGGNNHANCFALRDRDHPQFMEYCGCTC